MAMSGAPRKRKPMLRANPTVPTEITEESRFLVSMAMMEPMIIKTRRTTNKVNYNLPLGLKGQGFNQNYSKLLSSLSNGFGLYKATRKVVQLIT